MGTSLEWLFLSKVENRKVFNSIMTLEEEINALFSFSVDVYSVSSIKDVLIMDESSE